MRTLDPGPGVLRPKWEKECICTGAGNGDRGCGSRLLVEWDDLYLTCSAGDARDYIRSRNAIEGEEELLRWVEDAFRRGVQPLDLCEKHPIFVTFRCHNCGSETDLLTMSPEEIGQKGFHLLPTKREWDQLMGKYRKD